MKSGRQVIWCALAVALAALFTGCGSRAAVEGTVPLDDVPVDGGIVNSLPRMTVLRASRRAPPDIVGGKYSIRSTGTGAPARTKS